MTFQLASGLRLSQGARNIEHRTRNAMHNQGAASKNFHRDTLDRILWRTPVSLPDVPRFTPLTSKEGVCLQAMRLISPASLKHESITEIESRVIGPVFDITIERISTLGEPASSAIDDVVQPQKQSKIAQS